MSSPPAPPEPRPDTAVVPVEYDTTYRFLDLLFEGVDQGFVEFQYCLPEKKPRRAAPPTFLSLPLNTDELWSRVLSRNSQDIISFGPAPRFRMPQRSRTGKAHDVMQVKCVWVSINHARTKGGVIEVLRRIRDFPLRPSVVVNAGGVHQAYFAFNEVLSDHALLRWSELMRGLGVLLSASLISPIEQLAYLPGTVLPQEAYDVRCTLTEEYSSWTRYSVAEVESALREATSLVTKESSGLAVTADELHGRGLDGDVLESIITGRDLPRHVAVSAIAGTESGVDFRLAFHLLEKGFNEGEIKAIFRAHPRGCGRRWVHKRDGEGYLENLIHKVTVRFYEANREGNSNGSWLGGDELLTKGLPEGYTVSEDGAIWFHPPVSDESRKPPKPVKVCNSPIHITEIREHIDTGHVSLVVSFRYLGRTVSVPLARSQMADARQLAASLTGVGAPINSLNARHVTAYLAAYEHAFAAALPLKRVTSRFGRARADGPFFFPGTLPGVEFEPAGPGDAALFRAYSSRQGSLHAWLEIMRTVIAEGFMIPLVAVLAALVPPLQRRLQIPNFILDIHGDTSTGKSTSLRLAASIYGNPIDPDSLVLQWLNTIAAVEQVATTCSELPVFLDDAQHCQNELKKTLVYMIANGRGKGRGSQGGRGGLGDMPTWHTVALSTSEEPLHESSPHEGARGRILSVGGLTPPFRSGTASFVQALERMVRDNHGHAGKIYIRHLNGWTAADVMRWHRRYTEIRTELARRASSDLTGRVGGYIAAVQLAAELAGPLLGLDCQPDVVGAWLALHVDEQQRDRNMVFVALRALADYYVANLNRFAIAGSFETQKGVSLLGSARKDLYVGFLRTTVEVVFRGRNWSPTAVLDKLAAAGALLTTEGERHTKKVSVQGVHHRMICIKWAALLPHDNSN